MLQISHVQLKRPCHHVEALIRNSKQTLPTLLLPHDLLGTLHKIPLECHPEIPLEVPHGTLHVAPHGVKAVPITIVMAAWEGLELGRRKDSLVWVYALVVIDTDFIMRILHSHRHHRRHRRNMIWQSLVISSRKCINPQTSYNTPNDILFPLTHHQYTHTVTFVIMDELVIIFTSYSPSLTTLTITNY